MMMLASGDLWAGAEVMVYQLCTGLADCRDLELVVILLNSGHLQNELERAGIKVHLIEESTHSFFSLIQHIKKIVSDFSPDIIHSHRYKENLLAWLASRGRRHISLVSTQHGMPEMANSIPDLRQRIRTALFFKLLSYAFDRTVAVSHEMQQKLIKIHGFTSDNLAVIHNGINIPEEAEPSLGRRIVVGSAGRLFPVKDFSLFVDVAKIVLTQNDNLDFVLAGDGPEYTHLKNKVAEYGLLDRFRFLGHVSDMKSFYRGLDIYINTSVHEGIPMSVLEAMSYGLPVVVPDVGGLPEIVADSISGFLIRAREPGDFAEKILFLYDIKNRRKIGRAARQRVMDSFSREYMVNAYYELYKELIERKNV